MAKKKKNSSYQKKYRQADYLARQNNMNPKRLNDALIEGARVLFWLSPTLSIIGADRVPDQIMDTISAWIDEYKADLLPIVEEVFQRDTEYTDDPGEIRLWWQYHMPSQYKLSIQPSYTAQVEVTDSVDHKAIGGELEW